MLPSFYFIVFQNYRNLKSKMDLVGIFARYIQFSKKNFFLSRKPPPTPREKKIKINFFSEKTHRVYCPIFFDLP